MRGSEELSIGLAGQKLFRRPDLGKSGNVGSPKGFTESLRVEVVEQNMAEPWVRFGDQQCGLEHARAHRSELGMASLLRPSFLRERGEWERVDAFRRSRASPWRSCTPSTLTSRAKDGIWMPNVAKVLTPVGHVDEDDVHSGLASLV